MTIAYPAAVTSARPLPAPVGSITRGTTHPNRLRRVDRYCTGPLAPLLWRAAAPAVVVDLGYGANPVTTVELQSRLQQVRPDVRVLGLEIDPARVASAQRYATVDRVFARGGFECPMPPGWPAPVLIRAFNVLRQYPEDAVPGAWALLASRLAPGGVLVEGTCDEQGRLASWVCVDATGRPQTFTMSMRLASLQRPSQVAERLPKALIHRNVLGERVHAWLLALDRAWALAAPIATFGVRQRWLATVQRVKDDGWPVRPGPRRWRLGEVTIDWNAVAPQ